MSVESLQNELVEEFSLFDDWMARYEYMIDLGKSLPLIDPALKTDDRIIKGCQSKVWLNAELKDGKVEFTADSDAIITKGIIAILIRVRAQCQSSILEWISSSKGMASRTR